MIDISELGLKKLEKQKPISHTPEYKAWTKMKERCLNPSCKEYPNYGGRGIAICDDWINNPHKFIKDMGEKPEPKRNYSLERIDNEKGYCKDNCKWADKKEQARNRRSNVWIEYKGTKMLISDWADALGIKRLTLSARLKKGWSVEKAFTTPVKA